MSDLEMADAQEEASQENNGPNGDHLTARDSPTQDARDLSHIAHASQLDGRFSTFYIQAERWSYFCRVSLNNC